MGHCLDASRRPNCDDNIANTKAERVIVCGLGDDEAIPAGRARHVK
jgi:hypothetical protein